MTVHDETGVLNNKYLELVNICRTDSGNTIRESLLLLPTLEVPLYLQKVPFAEESSQQEEHTAVKELMRALDDRIKSGFWGYNEQEIFVPQDNDRIQEGRANPARIKYLYVADNPNTALTEVRPLLDNYVSIAEIKIEDELQIADLTYDSFGKISDKDKMLVYLIMKEYSKPNNNEPFEYLPTQYISEYIKGIGFDGIKYNSSLYDRGRNYVIL